MCKYKKQLSPVGENSKNFNDESVASYLRHTSCKQNMNSLGYQISSYEKLFKKEENYDHSRKNFW